MKKECLLAALALAASGAFARPPNYDESKVAPYTLEDPLTFADGRKLKDASEGPETRREIMGLWNCPAARRRADAGSSRG